MHSALGWRGIQTYYQFPKEMCDPKENLTIQESLLYILLVNFIFVKPGLQWITFLRLNSFRSPENCLYWTALWCYASNIGWGTFSDNLTLDTLAKEILLRKFFMRILSAYRKTFFWRLSGRSSWTCICHYKVCNC